MDRATFNEQNDAYVERRHLEDDPDGFDAWAEDMQEQEDQQRARQRVSMPSKGMRRYV